MGVVPVRLAAQLKTEIGLVRAVETGTYQGDGAERLASVFPEVVTIELSDQYHRDAKAKAVAGVTYLHGDARELLPELVDGTPTFYWLDGHWSGGDTAGGNNQCPLLEELAVVVRQGHPDDCVVVDDARLFLAPEPLYDPAQWPSLTEIAEAVNGRHMTIAFDQLVIVPEHAKEIARSYVLSRPWREWPFIPRATRHLLSRGLMWLDKRFTV